MSASDGWISEHQPRAEYPDLAGCVHCGRRADAGPLLPGWCRACAHRLEVAPPCKPAGWYVRGDLRHSRAVAECGPLGSPEQAHDPSAPKRLGSWITYLRRYSVQSLLGIAAEEDDDGDAAQTTHSAPAPARPVPRPAAAPKAPAQGTATCPKCGKEARPSKYPKAGVTHYCYDDKLAFDPTEPGADAAPDDADIFA